MSSERRQAEQVIRTRRRFRGWGSVGGTHPSRQEGMLHEGRLRDKSSVNDVEVVDGCYDRVMRVLLVGTFLAATLAMSACGDDSSNDAATSVTIPADVPDIVGDSVEDATAKLEDAGFTLRVARRDGEDLPGTADFVEDRVNVAVETQDDGTEVVTEILNLG